LREDLYRKAKRLKTSVKNTLEIQESAIGAHGWKEKHAMDHKNVLLKQVSNKPGLIWENILMIKRKDFIINFEIPPADHLTK